MVGEPRASGEDDVFPVCEGHRENKDDPATEGGRRCGAITFFRGHKPESIAGVQPQKRINLSAAAGRNNPRSRFLNYRRRQLGKSLRGCKHVVVCTSVGEDTRVQETEAEEDAPWRLRTEVVSLSN